MSLREQLLAFIKDTDVALAEDVGSDNSLIRSGLFDSLALFQLFLWVESQVGSSIDLLSFDLAAEWDTVNDIVRFIEARRT